MVKERYQNPAVNDTIRLKLFVINNNLPQDLDTISSIDIYYFDPNARTSDNPEGKTFIETISGSDVVHSDTGIYYVDLSLTGPHYVIGNYSDEWNVIFETDAPTTTIPKDFQIFPSSWYTSTIPIIYDFGFAFQPNRIVSGSKKWISIEIIPRVPKASALHSYYENLAISSILKISIIRKCDPCLPLESDLRTVVDEEIVEKREKVFGYYFLDTEDMDCGLYDVVFKLEYGGNTYVSERNQLLIWT